jgi:hypothetical protein
MMQHLLVPLKISCIQGLGQNISHLIMSFDIKHSDSTKAHLLLSKMIRHMEVSIPFINQHVIGPLNTGTVVLNNRSGFMLGTPHFSKNKLLRQMRLKDNIETCNLAFDWLIKKMGVNSKYITLQQFLFISQ